MHIDLDEDGPDRLDADVAIIGAGAAGLTVARRLLAGGLRVVLLESGGLDYEPATADLNAGENVGMAYYDLDHARLRFFGGTTAIWGGRCAALDPGDFARRDWVPHSGWPIGFDELRSYHAQARQSLGLPAAAPSSAALAHRLPAFAADELATPLWSFDDMFDRFAFARCRDVVEHPRCTVVIHATVREIVAAAAGGAVERLDVRSLGGRRLRVEAARYVLAAGGIENPRLLLASRSVMPAGLGNAHDQVGRFFMEHPHARGGRIVGGASWRWLAAFQKRRAGDEPVAALIAPSPALQARAGILNSSLTVAARPSADAAPALVMRAYLHAKHRTAPTRGGRTVWKTAKRAIRQLQRATDPLRPWLVHKAGRQEIALIVRAEQAPNPDSRVRLTAQTDATGMPRVALDWRTSALDVDSVAALVGALARETARLGLGRVEPAAWLADPARAWATDTTISAHPIGGYHHIGTTRMADDPRHGVTDRDGRVHGLANLYVAGSSLFPTSGWANPTLTIVALAMRTADLIVQATARPTPAAQDDRATEVAAAS